MPIDAVRALFESAREPKELIEMPGGHVRADSATLSKFVKIVVERMRQGRPGREARRPAAATSN
jgi:hypothetical protein